MPQQLLEQSLKMFLCDEHTHSSYPQVLIDCKERPFEGNAQFSLLMEGFQVCTYGDLVTAFALMFATCYIYNLSYPDAIQSTMVFYQTTFLKIGDGVKRTTKCQG